MPEKGIRKLPRQAVLSLEEIDEIVTSFVQLGVNKIRITGGEPLVRNGIVSLIEKIRRHENVRDLALTTNGVFLETMAESLKNAGLDRLNISLDTLNEEKYEMMTRGGSLKSVLKGIEKAKEAGLTPIKLNVVLIGGFNDNEIQNFVNLTKDEAIDIRFIELMPIGQVARWSKDHFLPNDYVLKSMPELQKCINIDPNAPAVYYQLPGAKGKVGLISPISCKFCKTCNRIRLTSEGKLKHCLHSNEEFDLREILRDGKPLADFIEKAVLHKPLEHLIEKGGLMERNMIQIGG